MSSRRQITRDITYSHSAASRGGRAIVRLLENSTGRLRLIKRADGYEHEVAAGRDFWQVMVERYGLTLNVIAGSLRPHPQRRPADPDRQSPLRHSGRADDGPYPVAPCAAISGFWPIPSFKRAEDLNNVLLPISFDDTKDALKLNLATRATALNYLGQGGAIGVFPGGTVSTGAKPFSRPMDPGWRSFTARMVAKSDATVVPLYFDGHTSRLFQIASHLHSTLRLGLLIKEFSKRVDTPVDVVVGEPIGRDVLDPMSKDAKAMMDFLRKATYELSPTPLRSYDYGFEFEERHRA